MKNNKYKLILNRYYKIKVAYNMKAIDLFVRKKESFTFCMDIGSEGEKIYKKVILDYFGLNNTYNVEGYIKLITPSYRTPIPFRELGIKYKVNNTVIEDLKKDSLLD